MRNYLYSLLTLALAWVASSAWAAGEPIDDRILTTWQDGPTDGPGLPIGFTFTPDFEVDGLYYKIIDGGVELTRARGDANDHSYRIDELTIPTSVTYGGTTYPVIRIGDGVLPQHLDCIADNPGWNQVDRYRSVLRNDIVDRLAFTFIRREHR